MKQNQFETCKSTLDTERASNHEAKKKVKAFLDSLSAENKTLSERDRERERAMNDLNAEKQLLEQKHAHLEILLRQLQEKVIRLFVCVVLYF